MSDKDLTIGLTLNDTPFTRAMDKARARMKQTIKEMEQSSKMSMDMLERRIARSVGSSAVREHPLYLRHAESIYWRDRYPAERGLGQELVAPRTMSRAEMEAAAGTGAAVSLSLRKITAAAGAAAVGFRSITAGMEAWRGHIAGARAELEKMPPIFKQITTWGFDTAGKPAADFLFSKLVPPELRGEGPQAKYLKALPPSLGQEEARGSASLLAKEWGTSAWLSGLSERERGEYHIRQRHEQRLEALKKTDVRADSAEYAMALKASQAVGRAEMDELDRQEQERAHEAEARDRERMEQEAERARQHHEQRLAEEQRYADELDDLRADVAERELTRQDRTLEAQRVRIRANYGARIREAERAGQEEKARLLEIMRVMEVGMVHGGAGRTGSFAAINTAYVAPEGLSMGQQDRKMDRLVGLTEEQTRELKRLVDAMTGTD